MNIPFAVLAYLLNIDFKPAGFSLPSTKKEVVEALGMSKQTFYKHFEDIEDLGVVKVSRRIGESKALQDKPRNPIVKLIKECETKLSLQIAEQNKVKMQKPVPVARAR